MSRPTLIVVSGPPGSGKTTLAHALARAIGCRQDARDRDSTTRQAAHVRGWHPMEFVWITLEVPRLRVDTTDGYQPDLDEIVTFVRGDLA